MSAVLTRRSLSTPQGVSLLILLSVPSVGPRLSRTSRFPCARSVDDETKRRRRCRRPRQKCFERARTAQSDGHDDDDNGGTAHDRVRRTRFWGGGERKREKEGKKKKTYLITITTRSHATRASNPSGEITTNQKRVPYQRARTKGRTVRGYAQCAPMTRPFSQVRERHTVWPLCGNRCRFATAAAAAFDRQEQLLARTFPRRRGRLLA